MHGHFQIQYPTNEGTVETWFGFHPSKDRGLLHDSLDEFLDYMSAKLTKGEWEGDDDVRFIVWDGMH